MNATTAKGDAMDQSGALTRRQTLRRLGAAGIGLAGLAGGVQALVAEAAAAATQGRGATLKDIEHVIFLIQEHRSFDHYFGTLSGVRGFGDPHGSAAFRQRDPGGQTVIPFKLPSGGVQYCLPDITDDWGPQHRAWNNGRMNDWVKVHESVTNGGDGPAEGIETMGYYARSQLSFYYSLADAFTICDGYHCSVIGSSDPNRLMSMSASLDPAGANGGPLVQTLVGTRSQLRGKFTWTTMPERLQSQGVSWKVYTAPQGGAAGNVLPYFAAYNTPGELAQRGLRTTYPSDFMADLRHNALPSVSWILTKRAATEQPGVSAALSGELAVAQVVKAVMSHPAVWRKTALFITWDGNGGFFDHVAPPVAPAGTKGEYLTVANLPAASNGIRGPIGLGFRVPMLVVSPFSRGGLVSSDTFDHTSMLRFLETRFGVEVPNLSAWRRRVTGDLTGAFNFAARPNDGAPKLAAPGAVTAPACNGSTDRPVPVLSAAFPKQEKTPRRRRPSGIVRRH
jgi:phospholipase C